MKLKYLTGKSCLLCEPEHSPVQSRLNYQVNIYSHFPHMAVFLSWTKEQKEE